MLQLHKLGSLGKKRKRIGRGGSRGGTCGKGHKGQKARSGAHIRVSFEGGQMPLIRRLPKRGFNNTVFGTRYEIVNLKSLELLFDNGITITKELLTEKGLIGAHKSRKTILVKILGTGTLNKKFTVHADAFSESAAKAITDRGGQAVVIS